MIRSLTILLISVTLSACAVKRPQTYTAAPALTGVGRSVSDASDYVIRAQQLNTQLGTKLVELKADATTLDIVKLQQASLDSAIKQLAQAKSDIAQATLQIQQVAKERDGWRDYGNDRNDKWMDAERRVAKSSGAIWFRNFIIGGLLLACGAYAYLHFGYHIIP